MTASPSAGRDAAGAVLAFVILVLASMLDARAALYVPVCGGTVSGPATGTNKPARCSVAWSWKASGDLVASDVVPVPSGAYSNFGAIYQWHYGSQTSGAGWLLNTTRASWSGVQFGSLSADAPLPVADGAEGDSTSILDNGVTYYQARALVPWGTFGAAGVRPDLFGLASVPEGSIVVSEDEVEDVVNHLDTLVNIAQAVAPMLSFLLAFIIGKGSA